LPISGYLTSPWYKKREKGAEGEGEGEGEGGREEERKR